MRRPLESTLRQLIDDPGPAAEKKLGEALRYAVNRCDLRLLEWLAGITGPSASFLDKLALSFRDHDGYPLVSTCIIASTASVTAKEEKEQAVRVVVKRWSGVGLPAVDVVDHGEGDATERVKEAPWTPLHLAALLSSPTLVSFLLTQGYSPYITTPTGLTPLDLIADMPSRRDITALLESMMDEEPHPLPRDTGSPMDSLGLPVRSRDELLHLHRTMKARQSAVRGKRIRRREEQQARDAWVMDALHGSALGEGSELVSYAYEKERRRVVRGSVDVEEDEEDGSEESDEDDISGGAQKSQHRPGTIDLTDNVDDTTLLVFSPDTLPTKLSHLIINYPPQAYPLSRRTLPANSVYMMARYAAYRAVDHGTARANLAGLLEMVMLEVERVCLANVESLPHLAFWLYNTTVLLHLVQSDEEVRMLCEEEELCVMMEEMIDSLQVHIIRLVEAKLDTLIDPALLDYESSNEPPVKFDDEWASSSFFRNLTTPGKNSKRRNPAPHVSSIFEGGVLDGSPKAGVKTDARAGDSYRSNMDSPTKAKTLGRPKSIMDLRASVADSLRAALFDEAISPSNITAVLSSTLLVLQIYSVNPAFIIQIFSQVFVWLAAETFNRIMSSVSGRRYQCRSKAMQIRLNLEAVAEWVSAQRVLPGDIYNKQFQRVTQLLQWLQCSSQITDLAVMQSAIQHLSDVTPLQLQRAMRDYRYEVGEGRISQDCLDCLDQMQRDWEHWRVKSSIDKIQKEVEARTSYRRYTSGNVQASYYQEEDPIPAPDINIIFDVTSGLAEYTLALPPQSSSEFEDSRYMLPLSVPRNELLPAFVSGDIYPSTGNESPEPAELAAQHIFTTGESHRQPLQYAIREASELRRLPDDFVDWLLAAETQHRDLAKRLQSTLDRPKYPSSHKSVVNAVATPEMKKLRPDSPIRQTERSPVSPVFAHRALRTESNGRQSGGLDRPIRLRQLSSRSNASLHQESLNFNGDIHRSPVSEASHLQATHPASIGSQSPTKDRSAGVLGSLTQRFRTRQASDASRDGYVDSSDEEEVSYH